MPVSVDMEAVTKGIDEALYRYELPEEISQTTYLAVDYFNSIVHDAFMEAGRRVRWGMQVTEEAVIAMLKRRGYYSKAEAPLIVKIPKWAWLLGIAFGGYKITKNYLMTGVGLGLYLWKRGKYYVMP